MVEPESMSFDGLDGTCWISFFWLAPVNLMPKTF